MEKFWNIIHYFIYKADFRLHLLFTKISPIMLLYKLPIVKRRFDKLGVNPMDALNKSFQRPDFGISSIRAGGLMYVLFFFLCLGIIFSISGIAQLIIHLRPYHFILLIVISIIVNYFLLFKQNKYRTYFKKFDKMPKLERKKWALISLTVIIGILLFFISSFLFMSYRLG